MGRRAGAGERVGPGSADLGGGRARGGSRKMGSREKVKWTKKEVGPKVGEVLGGRIGAGRKQNEQEGAG